MPQPSNSNTQQLDAVDKMRAEIIRIETIRWQVLLTLHNALSVGAFEKVILAVIQATYHDETLDELRLKIDYLHTHGLVKIDYKPDGRLFCQLTPYGINYVTGAQAFESGIARPSTIKRVGRPTSKREVKHPLTSATISTNT